MLKNNASKILKFFTFILASGIALPTLDFPTLDKPMLENPTQLNKDI